MDEAAKSLSALLGRLGAFFDIFDLSFFVSGAASLGAMGLLYRLLGGHFVDEVQGGYRVAAALLACYALGIVCFVLGRQLRRLVHRMRYFTSHAARFDTLLREGLSAHGLEAVKLGTAHPVEIARYLDSGTPRGRGRLYTLVWTKLRQSPHLQPSLSLINRYWVMAATCDGMAAAALLWTGVLVAWRFGLGIALPHSGLALPGALAGLFAALLCLREAQRYTEVQLEELVATLAWDQAEGPPAAEAPRVTLSVQAQGEK